MLSSAWARFLAARRGAFNNILALALVLSAHAEKVEPPQLPPQPVPAKVQVERGGSVRIPLQTFGIPQEVQFRIRSKPRAGRLSGLRTLDKGLGVVIYTNSGERGADSDRFTYAAKSVLGVSAEVEVGIRIVEPPPRLVVPRELDFGKVLAGSRTTREIEIENKGGGIAEGQIEAEAPWKVEGPARYRIEGGEDHVAVLVLEPGNTGKMERNVVFTSDRTKVMTVQARVVSEVEAGPDPLLLKRSGTSMERVGVLEVVNNTPNSRTIEFQWGKGLEGLKGAELAPLGSDKVIVKSLLSDFKEFESVVTIKTGKENQRLTVKVPALPGQLQVSPDPLILPPVPPSQAFRTGLFTVGNSGGQRLRVSLEIVSPLECEIREPFDLEPGETRQIKVSAPGSLTTATGGGVTLNADGEIRRLRVLVPEGVTAPAPAPPLPAPPLSESAGALMPPPQPEGGAESTSREMVESATLTPGSLSVSGVTRSSAVLSWRRPAKAEVSSYRLERGELYFDEKANLQQRWLPLEGLQIAPTDKGASAEVKGLQPGMSYGFRVVALLADGRESPPTSRLVFQTRPPLSLWPSPLQMLLAALAVMAVAIYRQRRSRRD